MFQIINVWVPTFALVRHFEEKVFPQGLRDSMMSRGLRLSVGVGTYLREGDVTIDGEVDPAILKMFESMLIVEGYRIFTLRPSIEKMVGEMLIWWNRLSQTERERTGLLGCAEEDLIKFHHNLGQDIRNSFELWRCTWYPEIVDGVDMSPEHPDQVSMTVIEELWRTVNAVEEEWNA